MPTVEIFSALLTVLSTLIVNRGLYKSSNIDSRLLILYSVFAVLVNFLSNYFLPHYLSMVSFVILLALFLKYIVKQQILSSLMISMITAFMHRIFMLAFFVISDLIFGRSMGMRGFYSMLYSLVFLNFISIIVVWFYYKYRNVQNISEKSISAMKSFDFLTLSPRTFGTLYIAISIVDTLFIGICTGIECRIGNKDFYLGAMFLVFMYSLLMILTLAMVQGLLKNELELTTKEDEVERLKNYTETIENLVDEMQKSRHDYKNMILSIQDFVAEKKLDELEEYFKNEILKSENIEKVSKNVYLATKQIKMLPLKSIINAKLTEAIALGINVEITIFSEINPVSVSAIDLCRIMGNLLDNAIEAAGESENKIISFVMLKTDNQISITLCNSFKDKIDLSAIWKKGYSSKGKNRGLGLSIVKKIIEKEHTNILLNTEIKNDLFVQDITIIENV